MAIIKPGPLVSEVRGKIGGVVFARNKGGLYIRSFAAPTQGDTQSRERARANFGHAANGWNDLTAGQRQTWAEYGQAVGTVNSLGETVSLSGIAAYIRSASLLQQVGQPIPTVTTPFANVHGPSIADLSITWDDTNGDLVVAGTVVDDFAGTPGWIAVQASRRVNPGRLSPAGVPLRHIGSAELPISGSFSGDTTVTDPTFPGEGGDIFFRVRSITADGRVGPPATQRAFLVI